jgi:hypothetical protein
MLTATPATASGNPTPTRSFQWLRNGTAITGADSQSYTLQPSDVSALVAVRQIERNLVGTATATSATVGPVEEAGVQATGGTETAIEQNDKFYRVHTFLDDGSFEVTQGGEVEYLVASAGGSALSDRYSGGGGGGGWRKYVSGEAYNTASNALSVDAGEHPVVIGQGVAEEKGGQSEFYGMHPDGGGRAALFDGSGANGACGGGGTGSTSGGATNDGLPLSNGGLGSQGGNGGGGSDERRGGYTTNGGGGGGATENGTAALKSDENSGKGGDGFFTEMSGGSLAFCGGGGGGSRDNSKGGIGGVGGGASASGSTATAGTPNTGGGSAPSCINAAPAEPGGSGIVIIRYEISEAEYDAEVA